MGTSSLKGLLWKDDIGLKMIYSYTHYDGYPDYMGRVLTTHYGDTLKAKGLIELGNVSTVEPDIDKVTVYPGEPPKKFWDSFLKDLDGVDMGYVAVVDPEQPSKVKWYLVPPADYSSVEYAGKEYRLHAYFSYRIYPDRLEPEPIDPVDLPGFAKEE